jgi:hypothetical protein
MKRLLTVALFCSAALSAQTLRWSATSGAVSQGAATTTNTIQQPSSAATVAYIDQVTVYCSVACTVTFAVNGTGATTTSGTVVPILPYPLASTPNVNFFTASNVGAGTAQGGIGYVAAGSQQTFCFSTTCGVNGQLSLLTSGTAINNNFSVTISAITGTSNVSIYGRSQ